MAFYPDPDPVSIEVDRNGLLTEMRAEYTTAYLEGLGALMERVAGQLFDASESAPSSVAQRTLLDARMALMASDHDLQREVSSQLQRLLDRSLKTAFNRERPSFSDTASSMPLSLLDVAAIDKELALEGLTSRLRTAAEAELNDFNIRITRLFGQTEVRERENPFRPYLLACSLVSGVNAIGLVKELTDLLVTQLINALRDDVPPIYRALNERLAAEGIGAELALHIRPTGARPPRSGSPANPAMAKDVMQSLLAEMSEGGAMPGTSAQPAAPAALSPDLLMRFVQMKTRPETVNAPCRPMAEDACPKWLDSMPDPAALLHSVFGRSKPGGGVVSPPAFTTFSGSSLLAGQIQTLEDAARQAGAAQTGDAEALLQNRILEHRVKLGSMTEDSSEQMVVDVVAMLFEFILRDGHVPESVRVQLSRLQFMVLKQGLFDPALFADAGHPARQLVNRIGSVSLGLSLDDAAAGAVQAKIAATVDELLAAPAIHGDLFQQALDEFEGFMARTLTSSEAVSRAVEVLENAECRAQECALHRTRLEDLLDDLPLDARLRRLLVDAWPAALERASRDDAGLALRLRQLVPRLVWSVWPKKSHEERATLLKLLGGIVDTLTRGLRLTRWTAAEQQALLDWLVDAHVVALRDVGSVATPSLETLEARFQDFVQALEGPAASTGPGSFDPALVAEAAQELDTPVEVLDERLPLPELSSPLQPDSAEVIEVTFKATVLDRLRSGIMVEFDLGGLPRRARLNWVSPKVSSLLLTVEEMAKPAVISVSLFRGMLGNGQIRFLEGDALFERAVVGLLRTADEMESWVSARAAA